MRRRDLAWLAVFPDPFTRLGRPVSNVTGPTRFILENDDVPIFGCGPDRVAHVRMPILTVLPGHFFATSPIPEA